MKVKEGEVYQPHSLGLSKNLRDQVSALGVCVRSAGMQGAGSAVERRVPVLLVQRWHGCAGSEAGS